MSALPKLLAISFSLALVMTFLQEPHAPQKQLSDSGIKDSISSQSFNLTDSRRVDAEPGL